MYLYIALQDEQKKISKSIFDVSQLLEAYCEMQRHIHSTSANKVDKQNTVGEVSVMNEWIQKIAERFPSVNGKKLLLITGAIGVLLLALSEWIPAKTVSNEPDNTAQLFVENTERRLCEILGRIEGVGTCQVMVTLENGVEYVYATEQKTNTDRQQEENKMIERDDSEESIIVIDRGDGREGLLVTEIQPTVKGVVVVCEGGDREEVKQQIIQSVTVALNITSKRVCVTKMV